MTQPTNNTASIERTERSNDNLLTKTWTIEIKNGHFFFSREINGRIDETYAPVSKEKAAIFATAIIQGYEPPKLLTLADEGFQPPQLKEQINNNIGNDSRTSNEHEKATIEVYKNSPHIWAGGLEGKELAYFLLSKANALLFFEQFQEERARTSTAFVDHESCAQLIEDYVSLGISLEESSPIHLLSKEVIVQARQAAELLLHSKRAGESWVLPLEYSLLPDLNEEFEATQKKKVEINKHLIAHFGEIPGTSPRRPPHVWTEKPKTTLDYLEGEHLGADTAQPVAKRDNQEEARPSPSSYFD